MLGVGRRDRMWGGHGDRVTGLAEAPPCPAQLGVTARARLLCMGGCDAAASPGPPGRPGKGPHTHGCPWPEQERGTVRAGGHRGDGSRCAPGLFSLPAQFLSLAGAQPPLLTLDPPWTPVFKGQKVTLTCGTPDEHIPTAWNIGGRNKRSKASHLQASLQNTGRSSIQCQRSDSKFSLSIELSVSDDSVVLQVPVQPVLEGDALVLRCRSWWERTLSSVSFFHNGVLLRGGGQGDDLLLAPAQQHHSGRYHCAGRLYSVLKAESKTNEVVVHGEHGQGAAGTGARQRGHRPCSAPSPELFSVPELSVDGPRDPPEGSALTLACVTRGSPLRPRVALRHLFYRDGVVVAGPQGSPQHLLWALALPDSGSYACEARAEAANVQKRSAPVTITVRRVPVAGVTLAAQPPGAQVAAGESLVLSCAVAAGTGPLVFSWHQQGQAQPLAQGPRYELPAARPEDGGHYFCRATNGVTAATSPQLHVTVVVPVAGATVRVAGTEVAVTEVAGTEGERLNLSCAVQAGTAPVAFTWLRDGEEMGEGPILPLGTLGLGHAGTYQCVATNQLGARRAFQVLSPSVALSVTRRRQGQWRGQALAGGLSTSLLVLLAASAVLGWHLWRRRHPAAKKSQERDPTAPPGPSAPAVPSTDTSEPDYSNVCPEDVVYSAVIITEQGGGGRVPPSGPAAPQEPFVTYAVLRGPRGATGPRGLRRVPSDSYENVPCA
ncbi:Fc receptor-like protein 2 isoform X2 [Cygnus olor]|uniref:Fc receptor-like protein 2 isoform X2 n=1 Tax=Cygnus olor TaxID=8869 RepID=UPI001ADDF910|nr:Fc receptor-like protein 2 isoform X2 [Cygnus olor]